MSDITTTTSSKKIIGPISEPIKPVKSKTNLPQQQGELPYTGSTDPIPPEQLKQIEQDLARLYAPKHVAALKKFSEKDLQQIKQEIANLSPKQLEDLMNQLKKHFSQLQATLTELKKQKKIDPEKAELILDTIDTLGSKDLQNFSKDDQQKLNNTIDALKEKVIDLIKNKQVDPEEANVLILFLAFAKAQMDQNDKAMLAGIQQTKVKTTQLELQAEKQKDLAGQSTQGRHFSNTKALIFGVLAVALGALFAFCTGGAGSLVLGAFLGATAGAISIGAVAGVAGNNSNAPGLEGVTDTGPDSTIMSKLQALLAYCNTQTQKLSSQLGSTEKIFVENASDRSAQLGQQAGQAITDMGRIMETK
ncbi:hypothetical protein RHABOEDO_001557 [Candidatus Rhabdochlamydia oedothoracis]|uniref:Uncharacterized protein n=1 Tax=Candidatus Rhabdochlamydia oedothoracis TaxID=2720720 RepID=A0ABX8V895_9BACT|nr:MULTISPECIES: hypothetical protein [Rhabdochlamydia]KAG6558961.1 hypothetical protein RHOW815_001041 [Candidatus Rhabdochlamydia sp. W815]MCL6756617.1 hypothetical protein [Candidatus Rhabdochlamydia oedothoracis]QYF49255.1 hypothetical protein RHABOEDO_001557 [Candidatus Rhabdochlamydia oedothoracis]